MGYSLKGVVTTRWGQAGRTGQSANEEAAQQLVRGVHPGRICATKLINSLELNCFDGKEIQLEF